MIGEALTNLVGIRGSWMGDVNIKQIARKYMNEYLKIIKEDVQKEQKGKTTNSAKQQFLEALNNNEEALINALAKVARKAYDVKFPTSMEELAFVEQFNNRFTKECKDDEEGCGTANFDEQSIKALVKKNRR
ncbi:hypothetical protein A6V39_00550 [Candidatus Mycoplasma haematobovis]|uniref:Uncharacterized protein n=1 Tax=Candidatus Mycoplasma haematobovis TaxID=432608 RepID=A0A1A9QFR5_9MOLU|nr:hypothetical protein [Candidatus Mycoplasma haematobovis]OAL10540.1 hypothetical protein A6V39_00550 [Candidatus Mycoplasma haematobovis]